MTDEVIINVAVPETYKWDPKQVLRFTELLMSSTSQVVLFISVRAHEIKWGMEVLTSEQEAVVNALRSSYPQAEIEVEPKINQGIVYSQAFYEAGQSFENPLKYVEEFEAIDPMPSLLETIANVSAEEHLSYELKLSTPKKNYYKIGQKKIKPGLGFSFIKGALEGASIVEETEAAWAEIQKVGTSKLQQKLREAQLTLWVTPAEDSRLEHYGYALYEPLSQLFRREGAAWNFIGFKTSKVTHPLVLSPREVAGLWHLPTEQCQTPGIVWARRVAVSLPSELLKRPTGQYIKLGENQFRGEKQPVWLTCADRVTHVNIVGRTRVGKSTFIQNLVHQDIANNKTVAVIDPHGDLVKDILATSIPQEREPDVILFDVADEDYPVGLNLLTVPKGVAPEMVATQTLEVIRKLFADQWSGTRMEDVLYAAIRSLVGYPGATVRDIPRLLSNPDFRAQVLSHVDDPEALDYWHDEYNQMSPSQQRQFAQPVNNRIRKFFRDTTIRRIICQRRSLSFRRVLDTNKIFLASLGGIGEIEAQTLGALLISKFQMAAMSRAKVSKAERKLVYLYIDEVQNFATTALPVMFSEAGKYGLSLVTANQFLRQLSGPTLDAIMGNVGTSIIFATGPQDAKTLGGFLSPFTGQDLHSLDRFNTVVKMQVSGQSLPAFSMMTPPPLDIPDDANESINRIKQYSRDTYGRPAAEIDQELAERYQPATKVSEEPEPKPTEIEPGELEPSEPGEVELDDFWE